MLRRIVAVAALVAVTMTGCTGDDGSPPDEAAGAEAPGTGTEAEDAGPDEVIEEPELDLVADGTLTVCTEASYPPFGFVDDSPLGYGGFDIDLISEVADGSDLGPITVVETGFEEIASGAALDDGRCDVGASAIAITEARMERVDFTESYYTARKSLLVRVGSDIEELGDLTNGMVIGVQRDTAASDRAAAEVEGAEIRAFEDADALFAAFDEGELDAVLHDLAVNRSLAQSEDDAEVVERFERVEELGFAVAQERDDDLLQVLDDGLQRVRDDGTYDELAERHFSAAG